MSDFKVGDREGLLMIHKVEDEFVISSYGSWRPGVFDSERSAKYASRFSDEEIRALQDKLGGISIAFEDLKSLREEN